MNEFDAWMWKGDEMRLFRAGEEIPKDWHDAPNKFNGADPAAFDHDKDGRAGGAIPFAAAMSAMKNEVASVTSPPSSVKRGPGRPRKDQAR